MIKTNKVVSILIGLFFIFVGVVALADIVEIPYIIGILLGIAAVLQSIRAFYAFAKREDKSGYKPIVLLVWAIILLMLAVFLFLSPRYASKIAVYLAGAWFIAEALASFFTLNMLDKQSKIISIVLNVLILVGGVLLILHLPIGLKSVTLPIGLTLIFDGISNILLTVMRRLGAENTPSLEEGKEPIPEAAQSGKQAASSYKSDNSWDKRAADDERSKK